MNELVIKVHGGHTIKFGVNLGCTGPANGGGHNGMIFDVWSNEYKFSGGIMGREDVKKLRDHLASWLAVTEPLLNKNCCFLMTEGTPTS